MGVRFLQTFISHNVPNGKFPVDIREEIQKYHRNTNRQNPTIVVDLLSLHRQFYHSNHELILGGRYSIYSERAEKFFREFKGLGVNLVFFADGPMQEEKLQTCLARRNNNYRQAIQTLKIVYSCVDLQDGLANMEVQTPVPFFANLTKLAQQFGEFHTSTLNECDLELAEFATRNNVFAIISNDTDFLIYEGHWRFWSSEIDSNRFQTMEFNREALRQTLNLRWDQMPMFATMAGNDIIPYDEIRHFHNEIKSRGKLDFRALADIIRSLRIRFSAITADDRKMIARMIFRECHENSFKLIENSLNCYDYSKLKTHYPSEVLRLAAQDDNRMNYIILANIKYIAQLHYFDMTKTDLKPFFSIISPLLQRIMGILLYHENRDLPERNARTFYTKLHPLRDYEPIILHPEYPTCCDVPPVKKLLFEPEDSNEELNNVRLKLICWQISKKLSPEMLRNLPDVNAIDVLTLLYLVELAQISVEEADCILLACNTTRDIRESWNLSDAKQIEERDCRISFLFTSTRIYVKRCISAVGLKKFCTLINFDGLYFHSLRRNWNRLDRTAVLNAYDCLRIYA